MRCPKFFVRNSLTEFRPLPLLFARLLCHRQRSQTSPLETSRGAISVQCSIAKGPLGKGAGILLCKMTGDSGSALRNAVANVSDGPISFVCPKETGERKRQQGEGFLPDALPLHPFLLTLQSVRPHIWAGCIRPPPLPKRISGSAVQVAKGPLGKGAVILPCKMTGDSWQCVLDGSTILTATAVESLRLLLRKIHLPLQGRLWCGAVS